MKPFMLILLCISLCTALWAQGEESDPYCYMAVDSTCNGSTACETITFTHAGDGAYLACWTICNAGGDPSNCKMTARITQFGSSTPVATCQNWDGSECWAITSPSWVEITLQQNTQYQLTVCLESCGENCCGDCRAVAMVKQKNAECPAP